MTKTLFIVFLLISLPISNSLSFALSERKIEKLQDHQLIEVLNNGDATERGRAIYCLGKRKVVAAVPSLIRSLSGDTDEHVKASSAWALAQVKDKKACAALKTALHDSVNVQLETIDALGEIGCPDSIPLILPFLKIDETSYDAAYALRLLTGKNFGENYSKWHAWYKKSMKGRKESTRTTGG